MKVINNKEQKRYELHVDGQIAFVDYLIDNKNVLYLTHTETPVGLEGRGIASELIKQTLQDIKDKGEKMYPLCPFVIAYIRKNPEWNSIVR